MKVFRTLASLILLLLTISLAAAQEVDTPFIPSDLEVITAENANRLEELAVIGRGIVYQAAWSPDGAKIAVASSRGIWLFDADNLSTPPRLLEGHTGPVKTLAFHPNSHILASGSNDFVQVDADIRLWDVESGELLNILEGHTDNIGALAFTSDGSYLLSGGWHPDSSIRIWRFDEAEASAVTVATVRGPYNLGIVDLAVSYDSQFAAYSAAYNRKLDGGTVYTFSMSDALSGTAVVSEVGSSYMPFGVSFRPETNELAYSLYSHVGIWDSGEHVVRNENIFAAGRGTYGVTYSHSGSLLAFANADRTIQLQNTRTSEVVVNINWSAGNQNSPEIPFNEPYAVAFSPDDSRLVSALPDNTVRIWDASSGEEVTMLDIFTPSVSDFNLVDDSEVFAAGLTRDRQFRLWNQDGDTDSFLPSNGHEPNEIFVLPTTNSIVYRTYNWENGGLSTVLHNLSSDFEMFLTGEDWYSVEIVEFNQDGSLLALNTREIYLDTTRECFVIFDWRNDQKVYENCEQRYFHFTMNADRSSFALAGFWDNLVSIWNLSDAHPSRVLATDQAVNTLQLNATDTLLAVATGWRYESMIESGSITVFDFETGEALAELSGHTDIIPVVAFSPDNNLLTSGSWDASVRLWDISSGTEINALYAHTDEITQLRFNPSGTLLASGSNDGTIRLWGIPG